MNEYEKLCMLKDNEVYDGKVSLEVLKNICRQKQKFLLTRLNENNFTKEIVSELLEKYPSACAYLPDSYRNNRKFMLDFLTKNPNHYNALGSELKYNFKILETVFDNLNSYSKNLFINNESVKKVIEKDDIALRLIKKDIDLLPMLMFHVKDAQWDDLAKFITDGAYIQYYSDIKYKNVKNINYCLKTLSFSCELFNFFSEEQKQHNEILIKIVSSRDFEKLYNKNIKEKVLKTIRGKIDDNKMSITDFIVHIMEEKITLSTWSVLIKDKKFMQLCVQAEIDPSQFTENFKSAYHHIELTAKVKTNDSANIFNTDEKILIHKKKKI